MRPEPSEETKRALDRSPVHVVQMPRAGADEETSSMDEERGSASTGGCSRAPICPVCHGPVVARVEGPDDAKEDCDGSESVERHGSSGIGFLPVADLQIAVLIEFTIGVISRVARPILGMQLEAVELLDVSRQEELRRDYNVTGGFVVNQVNVDSTAETLGIRRGDVIVFQDTDSCTSPQYGLYMFTHTEQLENYLLSLGWGYLQGIRLTADLKVEVHNLMDSYRESITFPLQFSDASRRVD
ncbi:hypothetical protein OsI_38091 [Oryza sativa Indica Group]|uniref:Uncharacterized protein n=1 Tax=Oryza sativa subsp. indica TaxID=39946 RepID=B8BPA4_ORYSI|nr:hypothetical protein OsI_38091 [Oryza sativa Indica Group]